MAVNSTLMATRVRRVLNGVDESRAIVEPPQVHLRVIFAWISEPFLITDAHTAAHCGTSTIATP